MRRLSHFPIFPILLASWPVLNLYAANVLDVQASEILRALIIVGLAVLVLFLGLRWALKDEVRSGSIASVWMLGVLSYEYVRGPLRTFARATWGTDWFLANRFMLVVWLVLLLLAAVLVWRFVRGRARLIAPLNGMALVLTLLPLMTVAQRLVARGGVQSAGVTIYSSSASLPLLTTRPDSMPDIYYIILDGYGRADMLREYYGYDNAVFLAFLASRGFYVARESQANSNRTFLSLATSLNLDYPPPPEPQKGKRGREQDGDYLLAMERRTNDNEVLRLLKARGYTTIQLASGVAPTDHNPFVDIEYRTGSLNRFEEQLLGSTMFSATYPWLWRERILGAFDRLSQLPALPGPKFVFAHIVSPHPPYLFDRTGKLPPLRSMGTLAIGDADIWHSASYIDQLIFVNRKIEVVVDAILAQSKTPPVIIIQGDHGPGCFTLDSLVGPARDLTPEEARQTCMRSRMSILNAYYLPGDGVRQLYAPITPVNSFRVVLNQYLGAELELLDDRSYVYSCGETCEVYRYPAVVK
jgi:hypothetical protein